MEIMSKLANVNLKEILASGLKETIGLQLSWQWDENLYNGQEHELYYVEIVKNKANAETLQLFLRQWTTVYEQLSMHNDYLELRSEISTKDSYDVTVQLEELIYDVNTAKLELWLNEKERSQIIHGLNDSIFKEKGISKQHILYLAENVLPTQNLFSSIEEEFTGSNQLTLSYSSDTKFQILQSFDTIHKAIALYEVNKEKVVLYALIDKLEDFYIWLKGVMTTVNYELKKNDSTLQ